LAYTTRLPMLALAHVPAQVQRLLESHPERSRRDLQHTLGRICSCPGCRRQLFCRRNRLPDRRRPPTLLFGNRWRVNQPHWECSQISSHTTCGDRHHLHADAGRHRGRRLTRTPKDTFAPVAAYSGVGFATAYLLICLAAMRKRYRAHRLSIARLAVDGIPISVLCVTLFGLFAMNDLTPPLSTLPILALISIGIGTVASFRKVQNPIENAIGPDK
jgi:hypothetical protein